MSREEVAVLAVLTMLALAIVRLARAYTRRQAREVCWETWTPVETARRWHRS